MARAPIISRARTRTRARKRPPAWLFPRSLEREYERWLVAEVVAPLVASVRVHLLASLAGLEERAAVMRPDSAELRVDAAWPDEVQRLIQITRSDLDVAGPKVKARALDISVRLSEQNRGEWSKIITSMIGVNPIRSEPWLQPQLSAFAIENANLITTLQGDTLGKIESMTMRGLQTGLRHEDIARQIEDQFGTTESRARLIARDQTSKLNGQLTELRQESLGIEEYVWRTSMDERVRGRAGGTYPDAEPSHWAMEGKICRWDDPTVYRKGDRWLKRSGIGGPPEHTGQGIQCRCYAEPQLPDWLEAGE